MGQRNGPRPIPSLLEYKTIQLQDRYSTLESQRLNRDNGTAEQGQGGRLHVDADWKPASASTPQLPPSLASYGELHSFSQMAQFLPSICSKNATRRPQSLLPLSLPGLSNNQTSESSSSNVKPFYRSSMPEAFLSASSNLINSSSTDPFSDTPNHFQDQHIGAKSSPGLECIGKSGIQLKKPTVKSDPVTQSCKPKINKLPPIGRSHCTLHSTACSCVHPKNKSPEKKAPPEDKVEANREINTAAGHRKLTRGDGNGNIQKGAKVSRKSEKKAGLKTKQHQHKQDTKHSSSSEKVSLHNCPEVDVRIYDDEEEGISYYVRKNIHHMPSSLQSLTSKYNKVRNEFKKEKDDELSYFHCSLSVLHPPPTSLPPIANSQPQNHGFRFLKDLRDQDDEQENIGWAKDGFLEDSALKRAIQLRNRALYNTSSNNTHAAPYVDATGICNLTACDEFKHKEEKHENIEEVTEISKSFKTSEEESGVEAQNNNAKSKEMTERKLGQPQHIRSVTWQDVSSHLGPKEGKPLQVETSRLQQKSNKLNPITQKKSHSRIAAEALKKLQQNRAQRHQDHTNCISTIPEARTGVPHSAKTFVPSCPVMVPSLNSQDLAISCGARTSKSLGIIPGKSSSNTPGILQDTTMLFTSSYSKFIKMFSLPGYKTVLSSTHNGKEKKFEGHIDGTKVKRRSLLEALSADDNDTTKSSSKPK